MDWKSGAENRPIAERTEPAHPCARWQWQKPLKRPVAPREIQGPALNEPSRIAFAACEGTPRDKMPPPAVRTPFGTAAEKSTRTASRRCIGGPATQLLRRPRCTEIRTILLRRL